MAKLHHASYLPSSAPTASYTHSQLTINNYKPATCFKNFKLQNHLPILPLKFLIIMSFDGLGLVIDGVSATISIVSFIASLFPSSSDTYSALRLGVGLNGGGGGNVPFVNLFNANYEFLGRKDPHSRHCQSNGYGSTTCFDQYDKVGDGEFVDIKVDQSSNQQPVYIELEQVADDGICLAYITHTWPDGNKYGWIGEWGAFCGSDWYESNVIVDSHGTKTKCIWLDRDHSDGQGFLGLHVYMPAFSKDWSNGGSKHPALWYCQRSAVMMAYDDVNDSRPRKFEEDRSLAEEYASNAPNGTKTTGKRQVRKRSTEMASELVVSQHDGHSAVGLCSSDTSFGPDFLSIHEGSFCDMGTKTLWPLCDAETVDKCFDVETKVLKNGSEAEDRSGGYGKVTEWN